MMFRRERELLEELTPALISGEISRVVGLAAVSHGFAVPVGGQCEIHSRGGAVLDEWEESWQQKAPVLARLRHLAADAEPGSADAGR